MNIFCRADGTIFHVDTEPIYQGSVGVNKIRFIGQFPKSAQVLMSYTLPNGNTTHPKLMTAVADVAEVNAPDGGKFSVWESYIGASPKTDDNGNILKSDDGQVLYDLDYTITEYFGKLQVQFYVYGAARAVVVDGVTQNTGFGRLATATYVVDIQKGNAAIPYDFTEHLDDSTKLLERILGVLSDVGTRVSVVESDVISANNKANLNADEIRAVEGAIADSVEKLNNEIVAINQTLSQTASDIQGLRNDFKNEEHFRGWVTQDSEFETLKGDANDFAYSAESGTVWIYNNDVWQNSGEKVPGDGGSGVASNETPLMDGTASAGTSDAYARGDHRHPADNNKLDKVTNATGYPQVYVKAGDGTQTMYNVSTDIVNGVIPRRTTNGDVLVNNVPVSPYAAVNKNYVSNNFLAKPSASVNSIITYVDTRGVEAKPYTNKIPYENQFCSCAGPQDGTNEPVGTGYYISKNPINPYHLTTKKYVDDLIASAGGGGAKLYKHFIVCIKEPGSHDQIPPTTFAYTVYSHKSTEFTLSDIIATCVGAPALKETSNLSLSATAFSCVIAGCNEAETLEDFYVYIDADEYYVDHFSDTVTEV